MQYIISFLEGIISFISPCLLPMLPIYITYFTAGDHGGDNSKALRNSLGFVLGFTSVFMALGLFFGIIGSFLLRYASVVNIVLGAVVILLSLIHI